METSWVSWSNDMKIVAQIWLFGVSDSSVFNDGVG